METPTRKIIANLLFLVNFSLFAQCYMKDVGLPYIKNYHKNIYAAGTQNWDIVQDKRGIMYFANNWGILEFDGNAWQLYKVTNESVVRSVAIGNDGRVYAGAFNEMGYLEKMPNGKLKYHSLVDLIPKEYRNFDEIWKIFQTDFGVVFQSFNTIFILKGNHIEILKPYSSFGFSFYTKNKYYIVDREKGILLYEKGQLRPILNDPGIFADTEIRFILEEAPGQLVIGTLHKGIFKFDGQKLTPWTTRVNKLLVADQLFSGLLTGDGYFAFGTIQDGIFISDGQGNIIQHINRTNGLQNNTVLSQFTDKSGNLWLGLNNGISYLEISSPITFFNYCYGIETGYTSIVYKNILYLGTNQGLFAKNMEQLNNGGTSETRFRLVDGTVGQVWNLTIIDEQLFCGHNNGTYLIRGFSSERISSFRGAWMFLQLAGDKNKVIGGTYNGLVVFERTPNGSWKFLRRIKRFEESSKVIAEDHDGSVWVSHGYKGIFRLELSPGLDSVTQVKLFTAKDGLPDKLPYNINKIVGQLMVATNQGIFVYNKQQQKFIKSSQNNQFFQANTNISQIIPDAKGNIWYFASGKMGVYRVLEDGSYKNIDIPFFKFSGSLITAFEHLYPLDSKNVFIGTQDGFVHYDPSVIKDYHAPYNVYIRNVRLYKHTDSIFAYQGNKELPKSKIEELYTIPYKNNSLLFSFAAPTYEDPDKTEFRYRLVGYDDTWSPWDKRNIKEYTNLHEGNYTFEVKAYNVYKNESTTDSFSFHIRPPIYRSRLAYVFYLLILASLLAGNFVYFRKRIERTRRREKLVHEKKMIAREQQFKEEALQAEKEIEHLKNEKLMYEIKHKNKELANSTMNLIQKNKFLSSVKNEIGNLLGSNLDNIQKTGLKRLLRHIDRDINNEKYWKVFDDYFDDVHQDFLVRMKDQHQHLSPKELRLCAYLRMNLSTKEISALMNISVRGVEVSRYRLRKKLGIERDTNLTEYILNF